MINNTIIVVDENGLTKSIIDQNGITMVYLPTVTDVIRHMEEFYYNLFTLRSTVRKKYGKNSRWHDWTYEVVDNPEIRETLNRICDLRGNYDLRNSARKLIKKKNCSIKEILDFLVEVVMDHMSEKHREITKVTTDLILKHDGTGNLAWVVP